MNINNEDVCDRAVPPETPKVLTQQCPDIRDKLYKVSPPWDWDIKNTDCMSSLYIIIESFRRTLSKACQRQPHMNWALISLLEYGPWGGKLTGQSVYVAVCEEFKYILWGMGAVQRCGRDIQALCKCWYLNERRWCCPLSRSEHTLLCLGKSMCTCGPELTVQYQPTMITPTPG